MSAAVRPSSPLQEIAARREWRGPTLANGVLTADLAEFCQSGVGVAIASCGRAGRPVVGRGLACRIDDTGRVRVLVRHLSNTTLLKALESGAGIAVTFTKPSTHRSIQLKALGGTIGSSPNASDGPAIALQTEAFKADLVDVGYDAAFASAYCAYEPHEIVAVEFVPEEAFVQTPGPSAGSVLQP